MAKLNQIIALANGRKSRTQRAITELHRKMGHVAGMQGLTRTYRPKDEEGEQLPSETKRVQEKAAGVLTEALTEWGETWEIVACQDDANTKANADIVVDGKVIATAVPVTTMLWMLKQLDDMHTFAANIPCVDPSQDWKFSEQVDCYVTGPQETTRTKKIPRNHVKAPATKEHPAQVDVYPEDVVVGIWTKVEHSGAMLASDKFALLKRIEAVQDAVREAKEKANEVEVQRGKRLSGIIGYIEG